MEQKESVSFTKTRTEHSTEIAEDYVEAIADLIEENGEARVVELAKKLGVTHVTVNRTLLRLKKAEFVSTQPYRSIFLTEKGLKLAKQCKQRHEIVKGFLMKIGVPEHIAELDAEGIEHHVSPETLTIFRAYTEKKKTKP